MKSPSDPDKSPPPWRFAGPRALGALIPAVTRPAFQKHAPAAAQLLADWPLIVGTSIAAQSEPRRLSAGTLTLACAGPAALELQHLATALIERVNAFMGRAIVQRLRFVQAARSPGIASPPSATVRRPRPAPAPVTGIADGPLRDALSALGSMIPRDRA